MRLVLHGDPEKSELELWAQALKNMTPDAGQRGLVRMHLSPPALQAEFRIRPRAQGEEAPQSAEAGAALR
jgi:hypothetical protein